MGNTSQRSHADAGAASWAPCLGMARKPVRGYIDGCFDLMHSGHYNAIRQAKQLCDVLVVGVHSDAEIAGVKGPPVMFQEERYELLRHVKWADELLFDVPYSPSLRTLELARADFCVHGDDLPVGADGRGAYDEMRGSGKLRIVKRTEGVSTTDLVGRLLLLTKENLSVEETAEISGGHRVLLATTRRIAEFSSRRVPSPDDVVVYVDGSFDLFHIGHALLLQRARALGTFLLVGVHDDEGIVAAGGTRPIMNLHERVLNVCSCRHVDEAVIAAPVVITEDLLTTMKVSIVVQGEPPPRVDLPLQVRSNGSAVRPCPLAATGRAASMLDPYAVPRRLGILREVEETRPKLTPQTIANRILRNRDAYLARNEVRGLREDEYYKTKVLSQAGINEQ